MITATRASTAPAYAGQTTTSTLTLCSGRTRRNRGKSVYRWGEFRLAGDKDGWDLLQGEYRTRAGAIHAAQRIGATVTDDGKPI